MLSGNSARPDLKAETELFRVQHYIKVYNLALDLTGSIDAAKELSARVFENAARLFEHHSIPLNCDKYLSAQVYLLYAQRVSPTSSSVSTASPASSPETAGAAPVAQDPKPDRSELAFKFSPSMTNSSPVDNASKANAPALPMESETKTEVYSDIVSDSIGKFEHPSVAVSKPAADETPLTESNAPAISEVVYDKKHTEFWTPDLEIGGIQLDDEFDDEALETEEEANKPSAQLSLLNAFLVIACLASIAFLLFELNVFPRFI